jgi:hypothetical protein
MVVTTGAVPGATTTPTAYSPEYYDLIRNQYQQAVAPAYQEAAARTKNILGGKGALYGTPIFQELGKQERNRLTGLGQAIGGAQLQGAQFQSQLPFQQATAAAQLGYMPSGGILEQLGFAPTQAGTLGGQQIQMTPYQQALTNATNLQQQTQQQQAYFNMLATLWGGVAGGGGGIGDIDWGGIWNNIVNPSS